MATIPTGSFSAVPVTHAQPAPRAQPAAAPASPPSSSYTKPRATPMALTTPAGPSATAKPVDPSKIPPINQRTADGYQKVPGYQGDSYCGPTTALMIGKYFGAASTPPKGTDAERIKSLWDNYGVGGDNGTSPAEMGKMLDAQGLRFHAGDKGAISQPGLVAGPNGGFVVNAAFIDRELAAGRPVIAQGAMVPGQGHWMLVVGVNRDAKGAVTSYEVRNPWDGDKSMTPDELRNFLANAKGGNLYSAEPKS